VFCRLTYHCLVALDTVEVVSELTHVLDELFDFEIHSDRKVAHDEAEVVHLMIDSL